MPQLWNMHMCMLSTKAWPCDRRRRALGCSRARALERRSKTPGAELVPATRRHRQQSTRTSDVVCSVGPPWGEDASVPTTEMPPFLEGPRPGTGRSAPVKSSIRMDSSVRRSQVRPSVTGYWPDPDVLSRGTRALRRVRVGEKLLVASDGVDLTPASASTRSKASRRSAGGGDILVGRSP